MPAAAWGLGITYPQSIKRLGQFLTADNISAGTPNGGKDISSATETPNGGKDISGATDMHLLRAKLYFVFGNPPIPSICQLMPGG